MASLIIWNINWWICILAALFVTPVASFFWVVLTIFHHNLKHKQWIVAVCSLVIGILMETTFYLSGITNWPNDRMGYELPLLLLALWLNMSLVWEPMLKKFKKPLLYTLFLLGSYPAYAGGSTLNLIWVEESLFAYLGIGIGYCLALWFIDTLFKRAI